MNCIITGASNGIGFETVLSLCLDPNHKIIALARSAQNLARLAEIAKGLNPAAQVHTLVFDVVNGDYNQTLIPFIKEKLGSIDLLINNAGKLVKKPFEDLTDEDWMQQLATNLMGPAKMIRSCLPLLNEGSHIVNISSMGGFQGSVKFPGLSAYSSSKAAIANLTECLAEELKDKGIKVNCLALGSVQTEMLEEAFPGYQSPVAAYQMGEYVAHFGQTGHLFYNGKVLPVALNVP